jgi:hypothetical protein
MSKLRVSDNTDGVKHIWSAQRRALDGEHISVLWVGSYRLVLKKRSFEVTLRMKCVYPPCELGLRAREDINGLGERSDSNTMLKLYALDKQTPQGYDRCTNLNRPLFSS